MPQHKTSRRRSRRTAKTADRYELYELSVQNPREDIRLIQRAFKKARGRKALTLREDFCGTAWMCAEWVRQSEEHTAVGLDLDPRPLAWGAARHLAPLGPAGARVRLLERNVLAGTGQRHDVIAAFNFSFCTFKQRALMKRYFRAVASELKPDGCFVFDLHGGPDAEVEMAERSRRGGFTYVWDQLPMEVITRRAERYIHFEFPDGTKLAKAFHYDWRVWTLTELIELLEEVGFASVHVYWEGSDGKGGGNGVFRRIEATTNETSWIVYVVAWARPAV